MNEDDMNELQSTDEFHESSLSALVARLGPPPPDVIEAWRRESNRELPADFDDWNLDQITVSATATLIRRQPAQVVAPPAQETTPPALLADVATEAASISSYASLSSQASIPTQASISSQAAATKHVTRRRSTRRLGAWITVGGLTLSLIAAIAWAMRPQHDPIADAAMSPSNPFAPASLIDRESSSPHSSDERPNHAKPKPAPPPTLETFGSMSLSNTASTDAATELAKQASLEPNLNPQAFALESLLPPMQADRVAQADTSASTAPASVPSTMSDVLASGDDSPPPESPQTVQSPATDGTSAPVDGAVQAEPLAIQFDSADQQPTWDLGRSVSANLSTLTVTLNAVPGVEQGWIEPLDEVPVKRARGIAVLTPRDEESVAIGIRIDVRTSSKLALRLRFAARLDPSLPWQSFTRDSLLQSLDYLGQQSLLASAQAAQFEAVYSHGDSSQKRIVREQRDATKTRAENYKLLLKRVGELSKLVDKIEAATTLSVKLVEGETVRLETIAPPTPAAATTNPP